jgi:hypothetical protein
VKPVGDVILFFTVLPPGGEIAKSRCRRVVDSHYSYQGFIRFKEFVTADAKPRRGYGWVGILDEVTASQQ